MATQRSATVRITNNSGGNARIFLYHSNQSNGTQSAVWDAAPGDTAGSLTVLFETGWDTAAIRDEWSVLILVQDGPAPGFYVNAGTSLDPYWKECQLQHGDADKTITLSVSTKSFDITLPSGGCSDSMTQLAPYAPITHVFVLMLENHSFDNIFAMSGIPGIIAATTQCTNTYNDGTGDITYPVQSSAPIRMPTDPGHEFPDVVEQLVGEGKTYEKNSAYPPINNAGFVANYATSTTETKKPPEKRDRGDVMACFATKAQLPVLYHLATSFAVCDQWFSSLPGPTWPNRFFVHGASSSGLDTSPSTPEMAEWELPDEGFEYPNGSIYDALKKAGIPHRFYIDAAPGSGLSMYSDDPHRGSPVGAVAQVSSLKGVTLHDIESLQHFATDLQGPYPYVYTFIEPNYGNLVDNSYEGGSSQHPMDDIYGGENLVASVYAAIRSSPYWETSLFILVYDEHGGFYDHVAPPPAPAPGDNPTYGYSKYGFDFTQYGVRVPAIIVSPRIPAGTVDHTLYDHSSVPKTLELLYGLPSLTQRDAAANGVQALLSLAKPRTDCPTSLSSAAPLTRAAKAPLTADARALRDAQPVPSSSNLWGAMQILRKTERELSGGTEEELDAIEARYKTMQTQSDVHEWAKSVHAKVEAARQAKRSPHTKPQ